MKTKTTTPSELKCNWVYVGSSPDPLTQQAIELAKMLPKDSPLRQEIVERAARMWLDATPAPATMTTTTVSFSKKK